MKAESAIRSITDTTSFIFILPTWLPTYEFKNIGKILKYLQLNKFKVTVYCGATDHAEIFNRVFPEFKLIAKREVYRWPNLIGHIKQLIHLAVLAKKNLDNPPIFWTYAGYRENLLLALLRIIFKFRFIIKNDSLILPEATSKWVKLKEWFIHVLPAIKADGIISETPEVFDSWNKRCGQLRRHVIYSNGADIPALKSYLKILERKFNDKSKNILMTGRLNHEKGVDLTVEAFCKIATIYPEWRLTLVGEIYTDESYIRACGLAKEFDVEKRILWVPFCKDIELYEHYYNSAIFLNTSRNEGLPNRFIEAMFFRCAVLSFDVGQCEYLLSSNRGVIVENGNLELIIENLIQLIENHEARIRLGRKASNFIEKEFNDQLNLPFLVRWMMGTVENRSQNQ